MNDDSKTNILIVDDDQSTLLALGAVLESLDQNVITVTSGTQALRQVLEHDFAVILLDVQMAEMNGLETAAAIREREKSRHIPIIFLTGMVQTDEMAFSGYSAGAVDYLLKPISPNVLKTKVGVFVDLALARSRLRREVEERTRIAAEVSKLNLELAFKNAQLEERSRDLQEIVVELESYSYSISHDMRAPLRAMRGYADILLEDCLTLLPEEHQGYLTKISAGAKRLDQLIQDVLSYTKISRSAFEVSPVALLPLVQDIVGQYRNQSPDAELSVEEPMPDVQGNETLLTQCLLNLIGNAIKFVAPGNVPKVRVWAEVRDRDLTLWVEDNGIGIAPKDLERIFNIFVKVHSQKSYAGTGIGLSIVKRAAEKMRGKVELQSTLGQGSRFGVRLKRAVPPPLPPPTSPT